MFGSAARADGDASSDIDLLIVRPGDVDEEEPNWRAQVDALGEAVRAWTGNHAGIVELGERDLDDLSRRPPPILTDLRTDAIDLAGRPVRTLLKHASPRRESRTQDCDDNAARARLRDARVQLDR